MRLRRSKLTGPGLARRRSGKGFTYLDAEGARLTGRETIERIKALAIPPAWEQVWISPDPRGHIQATGVDAAGRKQYLYHPDWRTARDTKKFDRVLAASGKLPAVRRRLRADLTTGRGMSRERVLAAVVSLLDLGMFRVGGDEYAARDEDPSFGLSTLRPSHVSTKSGCVLLAEAGPRPTAAKRKKVVANAMREVADRLGNTPAVARASYVDPRVIERYEDGETITGAPERAVRDLLDGQR